jgi:2-oxoglutarate dehydrogenase E2 component (dihydrolipoamide succinyltransferase)
MTKIILPELGEGIKQATLSYWFFQQGDKVAEKDELVELATDKATFNLPSPGSGTLTQVFMHEGDTVHPGDLLGMIE